MVALAAGLALGLLAVHLTVGGPRDQDMLLLYPELGRRLLDTGSLPPAEYPPLAIVTFAAATLLGSVRLTLPLLILPLVLLPAATRRDCASRRSTGYGRAHPALH